MADPSVSVQFSADTSHFDDRIKRAIDTLQDFTDKVNAGLAPLQNIGGMLGGLGGASKEATDGLQRIAENWRAVVQGAQSAADIQKATLDAVNRESNVAYRTQVEEIQAAAKMKQISGDQELTELRALAQKKYEADINYFAAKSDLSKDDAAAEARIMTQAEAAHQQYLQKLIKFDEQAVQQHSKAAQESAKAWEQSFKPIERGFDTMISGLLSGRETLNQAMLRAAQQMVKTELEADAKMLLQKTALWAGEATGAIKSDAAKVVSSHQANGSILSGLIARVFGGSAAEATGVATHAAGEATMTAATAAGNAERLATDQATATAGLASEASSLKSGVLQHAASAAAAVYDDVSQIPYVGWILAPPAAAVAFAAVAAYQAVIPSAAGGMWTVPSDTLAMVHAQESIIPASIANPMRDFFGNGAAGGTSDTYNITVQAIDTQSGAQFLRDNARTIVATLSQQRRNFNSALKTA